MKLIVNSSTPEGFSGYSTVNKNLIPRLNEVSHHDFIYFTRSGRYSSTPSEFEGVPVVSPPSSGGLPETYLPTLMEHYEADMVFHIMDAWILDNHMNKLQFPQFCYAPIDCSPLSPRWFAVLKNLMYTSIPYNEFGKRQIEDAGLSNYRDPIYHGVDVNTFQDRGRTGALGFDEDDFVVAIFKANVGTRANYDNQLEAVRMFLDENPEAEDDFKLYIHSSKTGQQGYNLQALVQLFDLSEYVRFPNQQQYTYGEITPEHLSYIYSDIDVTLNATRAEGFGLPVIESLACGTPVIISNGSAMKDVFDDGCLKADVIKKTDGVGEDDAFEMRPRKLVHYCWPKRKSIANKLEWAYNHKDELPELGQEGKEWAQKYSWDNIVPQWIDVLNDIEDEVIFDEDDLLKDLDEDLEI